MNTNLISFKQQTIFNSYEEFLREVDLSDRVLMFMTYDFDVENLILNDLILKLKSSNTRIHNFRVLNCNQTMKNVFDIVNFMQKHSVDTIIAIGEDFLGELLKAVNVFYNNRNINTLVELEANKKYLTYDKLKETIFIPTTGGCSEVHKYFRLIDEEFSQVTIFEDSMAKIDKIVLDCKISKLSPIEYVMYYIFSITANLVDIVLNDNVGEDVKEECKNILRELTNLLENGEKFGDSLFFREKILKYSIEVSKIIDNTGYGILYLYGSLIESVFSIPRNTIDSLGIEFLLSEINKKYSIFYLSKYFNVCSKKMGYEEFIKSVKKRYGAKDNLKFYKLNNQILDKVKRVALNFLFKHKMVEKYRSLNFNEEFNNRLFEYYLDGVNG